MNIVYYNSDNEVIKQFYQWDTNQKMTVTGLSKVPLFHFCNRLSKEALVVTPTVTENGITVDVPNILLQQAEPLLIYLYAMDENNGARTIHATRFAVIPRLLPSDYVYIDNVPYPSYAHEVVDIRMGYDGTVYPTAGDAVRALGAKVAELNVDKILDELEELDRKIDALDVDEILPKIETIENDMVTVKGELERQDATITTLNTVVAEHSATIEAYGSGLESLGSAVTQQGNDINSHDSQIKNLSDDVERQGTTIAFNSNKIVQQGEKVSELENAADRLATDVQALQETALFAPPSDGQSYYMQNGQWIAIIDGNGVEF